MNTALNTILEPMNGRVWREIERDDGTASIVIEINWSETSSEYFNMGWFESLNEAEETALYNLETFGMNIFKDTKIFPNIRPQMLKDKPRTLIMSGQVKITKTQDNDERIEIFFEKSDKTAILNRTQTMNIIEMYGPETDDWKGMPITLWAEEGKWFGKWQWGLRVVNFNSKNPHENGSKLGVTRPKITKKETLELPQEKEAEATAQPELV